MYDGRALVGPGVDDADEPLELQPPGAIRSRLQSARGDFLIFIISLLPRALSENGSVYGVELVQPGFLSHANRWHLQPVTSQS